MDTSTIVCSCGSHHVCYCAHANLYHYQRQDVASLRGGTDKANALRAMEANAMRKLEEGVDVEATSEVEEEKKKDDSEDEGGCACCE